MQSQSPPDIPSTPPSRRRRVRRSPVLIFRTVCSAAAVIALAGCAAPHRFQVEAFQAPNASVERHSYRLVDARPGASPESSDFSLLARDVQTALATHGMFLVQDESSPDLIVEVDFGISAPIVRQEIRREPVEVQLPDSAFSRSHGSRVGQPVYSGYRETPVTTVEYRKHLRLTARAHGSGRGQTRPIWSVHVNNQDSSGDGMRYARLMVAAAMDHIGFQSPVRSRVTIAEHDERLDLLARATPSR